MQIMHLQYNTFNYTLEKWFYTISSNQYIIIILLCRVIASSNKISET